MNILEIYNLLINHIDKIYVGISLIFCIYWILSKIFNFKTIDDQIFKNTKLQLKIHWAIKIKPCCQIYTKIGGVI